MPIYGFIVYYLIWFILILIRLSWRSYKSHVTVLLVVTSNWPINSVREEEYISLLKLPSLFDAWFFLKYILNKSHTTNALMIFKSFVITIFPTYYLYGAKWTFVRASAPICSIFLGKKLPQIAVPTLGFMKRQVPKYLRIPVCDELTIITKVFLTLLHCWAM